MREMAPLLVCLLEREMPRLCVSCPLPLSHLLQVGELTSGRRAGELTLSLTSVSIQESGTSPYLGNRAELV